MLGSVETFQPLTRVSLPGRFSVFRPSSPGRKAFVVNEQQRADRRRSHRGIWAGISGKRGASLGSVAPRSEAPLFWVLSPARTALDAALKTATGEEEDPVQKGSLPTPIYASGGPANGFPLRYPVTVCTMQARGGNCGCACGSGDGHTAGTLNAAAASFVSLVGLHSFSHARAHTHLYARAHTHTNTK